MHSRPRIGDRHRVNGMDGDTVRDTVGRISVFK